MKTLYIFFLLLLGKLQISSAQQIAFNKQYYAHKLSFNSVKTVHDGGCIVTGSDLWGANGGNYLYLKTDNAGNELWRHAGTYFTGFQDSSNVLHDVIETNDHKFLMCGELTTYTTQTSSILLLCVDSLGGIIWSKLETSPYEISANHLTQLPNGDFFNVGNIYDSIPKLYIEKHYSNGDTLWTKTISYFPYPAVGLQIVSDGGLLYASGQLYDNAATVNQLGFLIKLDTSGNVLGNVQLMDSISISPRNLCLFDSIIYLPTIQSHFNGPTSLIHKYDTSLNEISRFEFPMMTACNFSDVAHFMGATPGVIFYRGDSIGDTIWTYTLNEPDGGITSITFDSLGCGYACGGISDGVTSVGIIVKICDTLLANVVESSPKDYVNKIIVYPNPSHRQVTISIPMFTCKTDTFIFTLYDSSNRCVLSKDNILPGETVIDFSDLPSTMYHYRLFNHTYSKNGKLIIN